MTARMEDPKRAELALFQEIEAYLDALRWPVKCPGMENSNSRKKVVKKSGTEICAFVLGMVRNFAVAGRLWPSKYNRRHPELLKLLGRLMKVHNPSFRWNAVQLNANVETAPHYDGRNKGLSYCLALGDFTGGGLQLYRDPERDAPTEVLRNKRKWVLYDGANLKHGSAPVHSGRRYAIIFFTNVPTKLRSRSSRPRSSPRRRRRS